MISPTSSANRSVTGRFPQNAAEFQKLVDWVSASRSDRGDAHSASNATRPDAWLVVHVVGALILRLEAHLH
jgi:hypothetical protein